MRYCNNRDRPALRLGNAGILSFGCNRNGSLQFSRTSSSPVPESLSSGILAIWLRISSNFRWPRFLLVAGGTTSPRPFPDRLSGPQHAPAQPDGPGTLAGTVPGQPRRAADVAQRRRAGGIHKYSGIWSQNSLHHCHPHITGIVPSFMVILMLAIGLPFRPCCFVNKSVRIQLWLKTLADLLGARPVGIADVLADPCIA